MRMRIVHLAPTPFGTDGLYGGGERYPLELCRALARRVDVTLVTFGSRQKRRREGGLEIVVLETLARWRGHPAHPLATGTVHALRGADVVHVHHMRSAPARLAAVTANLRRQAIAVTDHGLGGGGWAGWLPRLFDRFLTVSAYSAQTLGAPRHKTRVIYGGADPRRFHPGPDSERDGVLFVGRITPHKGIDRLIQAMPAGERLIVAGTPGHDARPPAAGYGALLARLAEGRPVTFAGPVGEAHLPALYRRAEVFALPSVHRTCYGQSVAISELLGLAAIEAMASGTPVVCSRVGGLPEVVRDGETGFVVEPGDVDGLRRRLEELLGNPQLARRMGQNGRDLAGEQLTWDRCAQRCLDAYSELMDRGAR
jgi:glycosyltransferase involved in cell wall biosynthesis